MDRIRLGDIATLINGDRGKNYPSQADITDEGDIPFVNAGHLNGRSIDFEEMNYISQDKFNRLSSGKFMKGDVLYCLRGSLGKKAIVNDDVEGAIASSLVIIRPDYNRVDGDYLMFSLDSPSIKEQLIKANNGSSQPNLSAASVREYQIELPDMKVQKDVVNKLAKVRTIIDSRQHEIDLLDELIKARFVEMFGNPESDEKYPQIAIKDFTDVISGGTPDRKNNEYWENGTVPWVKTTELQNNRINAVEESITEKGLSESSAKVVPEDTVLIAMYGQGKTRGMTAILGIPASTNQACACILPCETVEPKYLWQYMIMSYDRLRNLAQGGNQPNLNGNMIKNFTVLVPPVELQGKFVRFVEQIDKSKVAIQKVLAETQMLFDSLMQEYFG